MVCAMVMYSSWQTPTNLLDHQCSQPDDSFSIASDVHWNYRKHLVPWSIMVKNPCRWIFSAATQAWSVKAAQNNKGKFTDCLDCCGRRYFEGYSSSFEMRIVNHEPNRFYSTTRIQEAFTLSTAILMCPCKLTSERLSTGLIFRLLARETTVIKLPRI